LHRNRLFVGDQLVAAGPAAILALGVVVDGDEADRADLDHPVVVFLLGQAEVGADLRVLGGAAEALLKLRDGGLELAGLGAGAAGKPVEAAELVEHGPADARGGVGGEGVLLLGVVALHRGDEPGDAHAVEIVDIDVGRKGEAKAVDDVAHEGEVALDEFLFIQGASGGLVGAPRGAGRGGGIRREDGGGARGEFRVHGESDG